MFRELFESSVATLSSEYYYNDLLDGVDWQTYPTLRDNADYNNSSNSNHNYNGNNNQNKYQKNEKENADSSSKYSNSGSSSSSSSRSINNAYSKANNNYGNSNSNNSNNIKNNRSIYNNNNNNNNNNNVRHNNSNNNNYKYNYFENYRTSKFVSSSISESDSDNSSKDVSGQSNINDTNTRIDSGNGFMSSIIDSFSTSNNRNKLMTSLKSSNRIYDNIKSNLTLGAIETTTTTATITPISSTAAVESVSTATANNTIHHHSTAAVAVAAASHIDHSQQQGGNGNSLLGMSGATVGSTSSSSNYATILYNESILLIENIAFNDSNKFITSSTTTIFNILNTTNSFVGSGGFFNENDSNEGSGSFFNGTDGLTNYDDGNLFDATTMRDEDLFVLIKMIVMSVVLGLMILITIIGNVFVIAAIILERNLQNVANYLVASLAVADLFVACLVMPLGAVYEISEGWILGPELCDIWTSCDVLCCTASILHLVAIAADRYWTVTNIDYNNLRTPGRVFFMIFCVWFAALIVSLAPQFGWKDPEYMQRIEEQKCMVSQDVAYQIFATCCTFYVPLLVILVLYWKIYKIARKRIQRHKQRRTIYGSMAQHSNEQSDSIEYRKRKPIKIYFGKTENRRKAKKGEEGSKNKDQNQIEEQAENGVNPTSQKVSGNIKDTSKMSYITIPQVETEFSTSNFESSKSHAGTELTTVSSDADESRQSGIDEISTVSHQVASAAYQQHAIAITLTTPSLNLLTIATGSKQAAASAIANNPHQKLAKRRQMLEAKRERKAAQTLAIITGAFAICWLPFFVMALLLSLCKTCQINAAVASLFLWLGYFNSTLNPIIYTIFNPEFRRAFNRILCGRKHLTHQQRRSGKI